MMKTLVALSLLAAATSAQSTNVLFADGFNAEGAPGANILNYSGFANWTVTSGAVDLVAALNPYGIGFCDVKCVDLAGTPGPGAITTLPIAFSVGKRVDVSFQVSGNQRSLSTDSFTFSVAFAPPNSGIANGVSGPVAFVSPGWINALNGTPYSEAIPGSRPYLTYAGWFVADFNGTFTMTFAGAGGDSANIGPLLDNVLVTQVPEPATWAMLIAGFGLVGAFARRQRAGIARAAA
jgi:hypothetical protein